MHSLWFWSASEWRLIQQYASQAKQTRGRRRLFAASELRRLALVAGDYGVQEGGK
jgi:hypothetical protein